MATVPHPYYPLGVELPGYVPNELSTATLIETFASVAFIIFLATILYAQSKNPRLQRWDQAGAAWFVLTGSIHLFFEGYYSLNLTHMPILSGIFGQLWKEYALSDSRYMSMDGLVWCMETVTAV